MRIPELDERAFVAVTAALLDGRLSYAPYNFQDPNPGDDFEVWVWAQLHDTETWTVKHVKLWDTDELCPVVDDTLCLSKPELDRRLAQYARRLHTKEERSRHG